MKYGLSLIGVRTRDYAATTAAAERLGFESVWIPEHLVFPSAIPPSYPYTDDGVAAVDARTPLYEPWSVLSFLAATTSTIRLGTHVYVLPLRHPLVTARALVTVDRLSGGRVILGAGVGWLREEYDAVGIPFSRRGARMEEFVPLLRRLWTEDEIEHHGPEAPFAAVRFEPKPRQRPGIPIELGGSSAKALDRAGRLGDGWIEIGAVDLADLEHQVGIVQGARAAAGRDQLPFEVTSSGTLAPDDEARALMGEIGVSRVIVAPPWVDGRRVHEADLDWMESFASDVIRRR